VRLITACGNLAFGFLWLGARCRGGEESDGVVVAAEDLPLITHSVRAMKNARLSSWILTVGLILGVSAIPAQGADSKAMTIRVISTTTALEVVKDREPTNALSAGDVLRARSTLRNAVAQFGRPKGAVVGGDVGVVTMVSSTEGNVKVTASLPGGTIRLSGRDTAVSNESLRVIGGTGKFAGARGVVEVRLLDLRTRRALNVYRLQLP
jgi:hypothetical protein